MYILIIGVKGGSLFRRRVLPNKRNRFFGFVGKINFAILGPRPYSQSLFAFYFVLLFANPEHTIDTFVNFVSSPIPSSPHPTSVCASGVLGCVQFSILIYSFGFHVPLREVRDSHLAVMRLLIPVGSETGFAEESIQKPGVCDILSSRSRHLSIFELDFHQSFTE